MNYFKQGKKNNFNINEDIVVFYLSKEKRLLIYNEIKNRIKIAIAKNKIKNACIIWL